jgi:hypothetical protein
MGHESTFLVGSAACQVPVRCQYAHVHFFALHVCHTYSYTVALISGS